jgi:hypothetical protein
MTHWQLASKKSQVLRNRCETHETHKTKNIQRKKKKKHFQHTLKAFVNIMMLSIMQILIFKRGS